jgi:hypothetical protein
MAQAVHRPIEVARRKDQGEITNPENFDSRSFQREIFEVDRSNLALQLRMLRRGIVAGADELAMIALEGVLSEPLSRQLTRRARALRLEARRLNRLLRLVERARIPKAGRRSNPKAKPRNRAKKRT